MQKPCIGVYKYTILQNVRKTTFSTLCIDIIHLMRRILYIFYRKL